MLWSVCDSNKSSIAKQRRLPKPATKAPRAQTPAHLMVLLYDGKRNSNGGSAAVQGRTNRARVSGRRAASVRGRDRAAGPGRSGLWRPLGQLVFVRGRALA